MSYIAVADTHIGNTKKTNQDSLLVKHAIINNHEVLMAIICDGMGGLSKGEVASATVIKRFDNWFNNELVFEMNNPALNIIGAKWALMLKDINTKMYIYGEKYKIQLGTTFTGVLFVDNNYLVVHVGDSRFYEIDLSVRQLTEDHTFVAREIKRGNMTVEQAKHDKRRNMLIQCVGASDNVEPQVFTGKTIRGTYLICSDGFRHEISENEMYESLNYLNSANKEVMQSNLRYLIETVKQRRERDNVSAILVKAE